MDWRAQGIQDCEIFTEHDCSLEQAWPHQFRFSKSYWGPWQIASLTESTALHCHLRSCLQTRRSLPCPTIGRSSRFWHIWNQSGRTANWWMWCVSANLQEVVGFRLGAKYFYLGPNSRATALQFWTWQIFKCGLGCPRKANGAEMDILQLFEIQQVVERLGMTAQPGQLSGYLGSCMGLVFWCGGMAARPVTIITSQFPFAAAQRRSFCWREPALDMCILTQVLVDYWVGIGCMRQLAVV